MISILKTYFFFGLRTLLPLVMLPILARHLTPSGFGDVLAVQSLGLLGSVIVQFGFHQSGTRDVSVARSDKEINCVISRVLSAQTLTCVIAVAAILILNLLASAESKNLYFSLGAIFIALGVGLSPAWYFRGVGRTPSGMAYDFFGQLISLTVILLLSTYELSVTNAIFAIGAGPALSSSLAIFFILRGRGLFIAPSLKNAFNQLVSGFPLFVSRASTTGFTLGSTWIVSLLTNSEQVAYFGVASKIVSVISAISQPILFNIMPKMVKKAQINDPDFSSHALKWGAILILISCISYAFLYFLSHQVIVFMFSEKMEPAVYVTRLLGLVCIISTLRDVISDFILIPLNRDSSVAKAVAFGGCSMLALSIFLAPAAGASGMAAARIGGEISAIIIMIISLLMLKVRTH